ncbi:glycosyltransferase [Algoriphagus antarcticus]|uniref:GT2 family glycosyltransferase n=1 Tax=Algoriphagus antarcticus TaxID=238540 RepID=A0A3E0DZL5_9BACT|nr:glycosyltransferase [Algoriphagus antarcticus]REG91517.1 GT2 family glycosyltransferase [Algoriphagus antarcticus]
MISIVICSFNGISRIKECLQAIIEQENESPIELIVVDNASTDGTSDFCSGILESQHSIADWKVIQESVPGLVNARLAGLRASKYSWVLFCDDDNLLESDFLKVANDFILGVSDQVGVIGSKGLAHFHGPEPSWFSKYSSSYAVGDQLPEGFDSKNLNHVYGACSLFRKDCLLNLFDRGFQPIMKGRTGEKSISGDDVEWCWLMQLSGFEIAYNSELRFKHVLESRRLNWSYYLDLKRGISSGAGLLFSYTYFHQNPLAGLTLFKLAFKKELLRYFLLEKKYGLKWGGEITDPQKQLALKIIQANRASFSKFESPSRAHFIQLKHYFGS